jgi:DNA-directed RNA polymerase specialized sigma24 family protein
LDQPAQLIKLLETMARNKLIKQMQKEYAARRGCGRVQHGESAMRDVPAEDPSPSDVVANEELLREFRRRLSEDERRLADFRAQGRPWEAIAAELHGNPNTLRSKLDRAIERVAAELGLEG